MIYKVLIVKNRFKEKLDIFKYLNWFKEKTPIEVTTEELITDFDVTSESITNGTFTGVIVGSDIIPKLKTVIPENKYNAVIFVYGNDMKGIRTSCCNGQGHQFNLYDNTEIVQLAVTNDNGKTANHELFHAFFNKLERRGIKLPDPMDTYLLNKDLSLKTTSNRTQALALLAPYWDKVCDLTPKTVEKLAFIVRDRVSDKQQTGTIICIKGSDILILKSLEREKGVAIPQGTYNCDWTFSPKFQKKTYELREMKSYRIHAGNYYFNSEGCILTGLSLSDINKDGYLDVVSSMEAKEKLEKFFNYESFKLVIL